MRFGCSFLSATSLERRRKSGLCRVAESNAFNMPDQDKCREGVIGSSKHLSCASQEQHAYLNMQKKLPIGCSLGRIYGARYVSAGLGLLLSHSACVCLLAFLFLTPSLRNGHAPIPEQPVISVWLIIKAVSIGSALAPFPSSRPSKTPACLSKLKVVRVQSERSTVSYIEDPVYSK